MKLEKTFYSTRFDSSVIGRAVNDLEGLAKQAQDQARAEFEAKSDEEKRASWLQPLRRFCTFRTSRENEEWEFDSIDEWYAAYDRGATDAFMSVNTGGMYTLQFTFRHGYSVVSVSAPTNERVERLMRHFNLAEADSKLPEPPAVEAPPIPVVVFIGHGRSSDWRDIKDHLRDSHHYTIEAYEVGTRAGHTIRDVLDTMLASSTFALLVMTAEDEVATAAPALVKMSCMRRAFFRASSVSTVLLLWSKTAWTYSATSTECNRSVTTGAM